MDGAILVITIPPCFFYAVQQQVIAFQPFPAQLSLPGCFQHGAARLAQMGTVLKAALAQEGPELHEVLLQLLLVNQLHPLGVERGKARRIDDLRPAGKLVKLHMARCMASSPKRLAHFARLDGYSRVKCVQNARFSNAGIPRYNGEFSLQFRAQPLHSIPCFRADTHSAEHNIAAASQPGQGRTC